MKPKEDSYADLTGRFPHVSSRGNKYIFFCMTTNLTSFKENPLKKAKTIVDAWKKLYAHLIQHGHSTNNYILDNECSRDLKMALKKHEIDFELTPPNMQRRNATERAIGKYKNHFLSGLATSDPSFPISEWDRLLPQANLTLSLLWLSRVNPKLSAYAYIFVNFDFHRTPLVPPGTKTIIHKNATPEDHGITMEQKAGTLDQA